MYGANNKNDCELMCCIHSKQGGNFLGRNGANLAHKLPAGITMQIFQQTAIERLPCEEIGGGGTNGGGGENGGDPGQGCPVTGPHKSRLLAKLQCGI